MSIIFFRQTEKLWILLALLGPRQQCIVVSVSPGKITKVRAVILASTMQPWRDLCFLFPSLCSWSTSVSFWQPVPGKEILVFIPKQLITYEALGKQLNFYFSLPLFLLYPFLHLLSSFFYFCVTVNTEETSDINEAKWSRQIWFYSLLLAILSED